MAKKTKTEQEQEPEFWTLAYWHDIPVLYCKLCPFDTMDGESAIEAHLAAVHFPPPLPPAPSTVFVADRFGNPVNTPQAQPVEEESTNGED